MRGAESICLTLETQYPALALADADPSQYAAWSASAPVPQTLAADSSVIFQWDEASNVTDENLHRATDRQFKATSR